jgi:arabinofuranosyltransferase
MSVLETESLRLRSLAVRQVVPLGALAILLLLLAAVVARTAWLSDDAYITFRTIDNFLNGYGLRWNVAERVQSFTHPLWLLLLTPLIAVTGNPYLSALALSVLLTACAVGQVLWLVGPRSRPLQAASIVTAMVLSKAFTDYTTSGLENSLSHALLAGLMILTATPIHTTRRAGMAGALVALTGMARLDLLLLAGPIGVAALRSVRRTIPAFLVGLLPLVAWTVFSVVYYGVPFPNTAYAKLATGVPQRDLWIQGVSYFFDSLDRDPVTLFVIASGVLGGVAAGRGDRVPALSVAVYLIYVARIGGDFMTGRFFTAPFVVSLCLVARIPWPESVIGKLAPLAATLALGLSTTNPTLFSGTEYHTPWRAMLADSGIVDERGFYFQHTGWLRANGIRSAPDDAHTLPPKLSKVRAANPRVFTHDRVGMVGYYTGPDRHIIDTFALSDPLLARLPTNVPWRIGHFARDLPGGYLESVEQDRNRVEDPRIASLYTIIRLVTRGPIWSARRWRAIVALNTGRTEGWPSE